MPSVRLLPLALLLAITAPSFADDGERVASQRYKDGKKKLDDGDFSGAIDDLRASIASKPNGRAFLLLGTAFTRASDLTAAKKAFEDFLAAEPKSSKRKTVENLIRELDVLAKTKLAVSSTPPGATVFLDLRAEGPRGKTPFELPATPGNHRIVFELEGYDVATETVKAIESQIIPVTVTLKPKGCDLIVDVTVENARVKVDGEDASLARATRIATGPHTVDVTAPGYKKESRQIACEGQKPIRLPIELTEAGNGWIAFKLPAGASLKVDGKSIPAASASRVELPAGLHKVDIDKPGHASFHTSASVEAARGLELEPRLDPAASSAATTIEVITDPADALVRIDNELQTPGARATVKPGEHTIWAAARGRDPFSRTITVAAGESVRVSANLVPRGGRLLGLGIGATAVAVALEAMSLGAFFTNGQELPTQTQKDRWQTFEDIGHVLAACSLAIALVGYVGGVLLSISTPDPPP